MPKLFSFHCSTFQAFEQAHPNWREEFLVPDVDTMSVYVPAKYHCRGHLRPLRCDPNHKSYGGCPLFDRSKHLRRQIKIEAKAIETKGYYYPFPVEG